MSNTYNVYSIIHILNNYEDVMEIRVLRYFLTIAQEKNISKAAKILHISQPTLSRQIKDLENELDITLFNRGYKEIKLTEDGNYLVSQAKQILNSVDKTINNLSNKTNITGDLYIGAGESPTNLSIAKTIAEVHKEHPNIKFHLYSGNADDQKRFLESGLLDFAVLINPADKTNYDSLPLPYIDKWGLLIRKDSPLAKLDKITNDQVRNLPLIVSRQHLVSDQLSHWFGMNISNLNIVSTYNLIYNASLLVRTGVGYVLGLKGIINTTNSDLKFIPLSPELSATSSIVWNKQNALPKAAAIFLAELKKTTASEDNH